MLHERGGEGKDIGVGERRKEERKEGRREGTKKSSMVIGECYSEVRIKYSIKQYLFKHIMTN